MKLYLLKKKKGRKYNSEALICRILDAEGTSGLKAIHSESGAPAVFDTKTGKQSAIFDVSVSDTKNYWVCVLSTEGPVGIDIEEKGRKIFPKILSRLHPLEREYMAGLEEGSGEWQDEFLAIWTGKEAYSKYICSGLSAGFNRFSVIDRSIEYSTIVNCSGRPDGFLSRPYIAAGLVCALCSSPDAGHISPEIHQLDDEGEPAFSPFDTAASLLSVRNMSTEELVRKLCAKGCTSDEAKSTAAELEQRGYIDDTSYACRQAELAYGQGKSKLRIKRELAQKGLSQEDIQNAIDQADESGLSEYERALMTAEKILPLENTGNTGIQEDRQSEVPAEPDKKQLAKLARRLNALGYSPSVIYSVLDRYK